MYELDGHKLHLHPDKLDCFDRGALCAPVTVEMSLSAACNHHCTFCAMDYRRATTHPQATDVLNTIRKLRDFGVRGVVFAGEGEPTLHPEFIHIMSQCPLPFGVMTNGWRIDDDMAKIMARRARWVRFSINGGTEEVYKKVHGVKDGVWGEVWTNVRKVASGACTVGVQLALCEDNKHSLAEWRDAGLRAGVDYMTVKPLSTHPNQLNAVEPVYDYAAVLTQVPSECVREEAFERAQHGKGYWLCRGRPFFMFVAADGECYGCAQDVGTDRTFGNVYIDTVEHVVFGQARMRGTRVCQATECRNPCRLDAINTFLDERERTRHVEFV